MIKQYILERFSFYIRRAEADLMPLHWYLPERNIFDYEILFIEKGAMTFTLEDETFTAKQNDVILIPPRKKHSLQTFGEDRLLQPHIHFDFIYDGDSPNVYIPFVVTPESQFYSKTRKDYWKKLNLPVVINNLPDIIASEIKKLIYDIINLQMAFDTSSILKKKSIMFELLSFLIDYCSTEKENHNQNITFIVQLTNMYIEKQLNKKFDLDEIAKKFNYSKNYLSFLYRKQTAITPKHQYQITKCKKAMQYLCLEKLTISEISYTLGFNTPSDFSRFFRKETGLSPTQYRMQLH